MDLVVLLQLHALLGRVVELKLAHFRTLHWDEVDRSGRVGESFEHAGGRVFVAFQSISVVEVAPSVAPRFVF